MKEKPNYMESIIIEASKEKVFSIIEDSELQKEWLEGYKEVKILKKTEDLIGTEFEEKVTINNEEHIFHGRILKYEKNHILKIALNGIDKNIKLEYNVERLEKKRSLLIIKIWLEDGFIKNIITRKTSLDRINEQLEKIKSISERA
ncbi:SRPBCC family protein [Cetobacterium sp. SF1]|uniref:SRPBCC family protein n=1 Tax=Cetobacterium sp. SF1 TaxID=3417654 RepID=UPI003CEDEB12